MPVSLIDQRSDWERSSDDEPLKISKNKLRRENMSLYIIENTSGKTVLAVSNSQEGGWESKTMICRSNDKLW
jgi:hypothetical protein